MYVIFSDKNVLILTKVFFFQTKLFLNIYYEHGDGRYNLGYYIRPIVNNANKFEIINGDQRYMYLMSICRNCPTYMYLPHATVKR